MHDSAARYMAVGGCTCSARGRVVAVRGRRCLSHVSGGGPWGGQLEDESDWSALVTKTSGARHACRITQRQPRLHQPISAHGCTDGGIDRVKGSAAPATSATGTRLDQGTPGDRIRDRIADCSNEPPPDLTGAGEVHIAQPLGSRPGIREVVSSTARTEAMPYCLWCCMSAAGAQVGEPSAPRLRDASNDVVMRQHNTK